MTTEHDPALVDLAAAAVHRSSTEHGYDVRGACVCGFVYPTPSARFLHEYEQAARAVLDDVAPVVREAALNEAAGTFPGLSALNTSVPTWLRDLAEQQREAAGDGR
ncbi:hypothetical protein [Nocardioides sp. LML1-1-1.1]|uniref:hypothetical protein n=1 Tax=Nocardioides sp. LML1-1-1.1 TaxID=3135248 RepID=UPI003416898A